MVTTNLGLTVDLPQDSTDVPTQVNTDNENFKLIDAAVGNIAAVLDNLNGEVV